MLANLFENLIAMVLGSISPKIIKMVDIIRTPRRMVPFGLPSGVTYIATREPMATLTIVFPVKIDTSNFLGLDNKFFSFPGTSSRCDFKLKYAVSVPEKKADKNINKIKREISQKSIFTPKPYL